MIALLFIFTDPHGDSAPLHDTAPCWASARRRVEEERGAALGAGVGFWARAWEPGRGRCEQEASNP